VERALGRGGMSVVYLARDRQLLAKRVVIKVLLEETSRMDGTAWPVVQPEADDRRLAARLRRRQNPVDTSSTIRCCAAGSCLNES